MSRKDVVAYRITETVADPIPVSRARVRADKVAKLGYVAVASCRHCRDGLVIVEDGLPWVHQQTRIRSCRHVLARTGPTQPQGAHPLEPHPKTKVLHCPTCTPEAARSLDQV